MIKRLLKKRFLPFMIAIFSFFTRILLEIKRPEQSTLDIFLWNLSVNKDDHLVIGECDCRQLAEIYGTPLYAINEDELITSYEHFCERFKAYTPNVEIYYSYKTNPVPGVLKILHQRGAGAEVISSYELWLAFKQGVNPDKIIYNGPYKSVDSLKIAVERKIRLINIDSFREIDIIDKIAKEMKEKPRVGIRVYSGDSWTSQFGFNIENGEALEAFKQCVKKKNLHLCGIHAHQSTIKETQTYASTIKHMVKLAKEVKKTWDVDIDYFDLGGGFGIPTVKNFSRFESLLNKSGFYPPSPPRINDCPTVDTYAKKIVHCLDEMCTYYQLKQPKLFLEPGRIITSSAQILLLGVHAIKQQKERIKCIIVDGGINIAFPTTFEYHEVFLANRMSEKHKEIYKVAGPICTPMDQLYRFKVLPRLQAGDILAIMDAGAYFISFSNNFSFPRPAIVGVSNGNHFQIRKRESFDDMIDLDES